MIRESLKKLIGRIDLSEEEMAALVGEIMSGNATDAQIGAIMAGLAAKGETFSELAGAARAMRRKAVRIQTNADIVVDTCGTGGDASNTFNISTTGPSLWRDAALRWPSTGTARFRASAAVLICWRH
jgi:anthranilate phosphoribosyltransferase